MKVLVTGVTGQLGYDVVKELKKRKIDHLGVSSKEFDISDFEQTRKFILTHQPDVVIHCAAYTAVDQAEEEVQIAEKVNVLGTNHIALVCKEIDAKMVYISTDYVFDGKSTVPYEVEDKTNPMSVYGKTKRDGENKVRDLVKKHFIVRISWVFGKNENNFIKTMLRIGKQQEEISVVADQIGSPTYTVDLSVLLVSMIQTEKYGTYHATNEGYCSWAQLAEEIFRVARYETKVRHITSSAYPTKAMRPLNSRLSKKSLEDSGFCKLPNWQDAVARYLKEPF